MTRRAGHLLRGLVATTSALALLSGCGLLDRGSGDDAAPDEPKGASGLPGSERQLTPEDAESALPGPPPDGAPVDQTTTTVEDTSSTPARCHDLMHADAPDGLSDSKVAEAASGWSERVGGSPREYRFRITSHSAEVPSEPLDRAGSALRTCGEFTYTGTDDEGAFVHRVWAEPVAVGNVGSQTFAMRYETEQEHLGRKRGLYVHQIVVRTGHNLISATQLSFEEDLGPDRLERHTREILERLDE